MSSILDIGVARTPKRELEITNIEKKRVTLRNGDSAEKIIFDTIESSSGKTFKISDAWVSDQKIAGLWFTLVGDEINKTSTLAKVLEHYEADVLGDLIGKKVVAYPDENNFLVMCAYDM